MLPTGGSWWRRDVPMACVVGPYNSGVGAETLPLYLAAGVVPIRLTSADATAGLGFTLQPMTSQIAPAAADALTKWAEAKSVAIIYDQSALVTTEASTGNRQPATVVVTTTDAKGQLHVDPSWAKAVGADAQ
jgi:hypothetical protein